MSFNIYKFVISGGAIAAFMDFCDDRGIEFDSDSLGYPTIYVGDSLVHDDLEYCVRQSVPDDFDIVYVRGSDYITMLELVRNGKVFYSFNERLEPDLI